jgi:hypothetical protein
MTRVAHQPASFLSASLRGRWVTGSILLFITHGVEFRQLGDIDGYAPRLVGNGRSDAPRGCYLLIKA